MWVGGGEVKGRRESGEEEIRKREGGIREKSDFIVRCRSLKLYFWQNIKRKKDMNFVSIVWNSERVIK